VAAVSGAAFGSDNHICLSYATSLKNIEEGVKRIKNTIAKLDQLFISPKYQAINDMIAAIGLPADKLCLYCWQGK